MDRSIEQAQTKLFTIHSRIDNWPHGGQRYSSVGVIWHVGERQEPPVPYRKAIENYEPSEYRTRTEFYIDGLFTEEETVLLGKYLSEHHNTEIELEEAHLPVSDNRIGMWCLPLDNRRDIYQLHKEDGYDLPFKVGGWYDISSSKEWREFAEEQVEFLGNTRLCSRDNGRYMVKNIIDILDLVSEIDSLDHKAQKAVITLVDELSSRNTSAQKRELLAKYREREPKRFLQFDGFVVSPDTVDDIMRPDVDGHCIFSTETVELMHGSNVRMLITLDTTQDDAIQLLGKIQDWITKDGLDSFGCRGEFTAFTRCD